MTPDKPHDQMTREELLGEIASLRQRVAGLETFRTGLGRARTFIRESDFRYRSLFENSPISLWEEDLSGVSLFLEDLRSKGVQDVSEYLKTNHPASTLHCLGLIKVIDVNGATLRLLEADSKDSLLQKLDGVLAESSLDAMGNALESLALGATEFTGEIDQITLKGNVKRVIVHLCLAPGFERSMERVIVSLIDISAHKDLEDKLRQATQDAQKANEIKGRILANMSHEIRTPMNAILGMADLLWETSLSPAQQTYVKIFRQAGENLLGIINDVLDLSKIEAGKLTPESIPFDPVALAEETRMILHAKAQAKNLCLQCMAAPETPRRVLGDPARVQQILINFVDNALKFTHHGGVTLEVLPAPPEQRLSPQLVFRVTDTGIGIAEDKQERIFQCFYQADISSTRQYGGTGLGLTICRQLAELIGGRVGVASTPGQGSTFTLHISLVPVADDAASPHPPQQPERETLPKAAGEGRRILLADDSQNNLMLMEFYLKRSPHTLHIVHNGLEAVDAFKKQPFDIVLMDIQMPVMDGHAATKTIRAWESENKSPPVPILALTAYAFDEDRRHSLAAGCNGHLTKPVKKRALLEAIEQYCQ